MTRSGERSRGRAGEVDTARLTLRRSLAATLTVLALAACGERPSDDAQDGASYRRPKNAAGRADSVRVADVARAELRRRGQTDSLLVVSFTRGANGYLLKLVPASNPEAQQGGGSVWVDEDGSATVMQEYRPR